MYDVRHTAFDVNNTILMYDTRHLNFKKEIKAEVKVKQAALGSIQNNYLPMKKIPITKALNS